MDVFPPVVWRPFKASTVKIKTKFFICLDCSTGVYTHLLTADPNVSFISVSHCKKIVQMRMFIWSVFTLNTDIYSVILHILSKYGKIRIKEKPIFKQF